MDNSRLKGINYKIRRKVAESGFPTFLKLLATHELTTNLVSLSSIYYLQRESTGTDRWVNHDGETQQRTFYFDCPLSQRKQKSEVSMYAKR